MPDKEAAYIPSLETSNGVSITYAAIRQAMKGNFEATFGYRDAKLIDKAVNQGIDTHLEACYCPSRGDRYTPDKHGQLNAVISKESLPTLVRRLYEMADDDAAQLADFMLTVLGFDDAGTFVGREALGLD